MNTKHICGLLVVDHCSSVICNKLSEKMSSAGSNALMALKSKMQGLRVELDKANDQLEDKNREFEAEKESRTQVYVEG